MTNGKFKFLRRLGAGNFGEVVLAFDSHLAVQRALKIVSPMNISNISNFFSEAQTLREVQNPHVVRVFEADRLPDGKIYIAMEYLRRGSIEDQVKGGSMLLTRAINYMCDALKGLEYVHEKGKLHRDVKPSNILIDDYNRGRLSDFGLAISYGKYTYPSTKGYVYHIAPETIKKNEVSVGTDIYQAGVTLYRMVNGDSFLPIFKNKSKLEKAVLRKKFPNRNSYKIYIPNSLKRAINKAISVNPNERYKSAEEFRRALERIEIRCNWEEDFVKNGIIWSGSYGRRHKNQFYVEVRFLNIFKKRYDVLTLRGRSKNKLMKISKYCRKNVSKRDALKFARKVLLTFSSGRL